MTSGICKNPDATISEEEGLAKLQEMGASYSTLDEWKARREKIKTGLFQGMNLFPLPSKAPLKAVIHSKREYDGYSVENVFFESFPGFFVTGNLYKPAVIAGKVPGILSVHGHWNNVDDMGRLRKDTQTRNAVFARMGAVVFTYDMVGYANSDQASHCIDEILALQTWNSLRAVDFLLSLGFIDSSRIGMTGASGGGSQTIYAVAMDDRIAVSVPVVMVSAHFIGGGTCESGMPVYTGEGYETNNVEIAALAAPRPMLLISDGDDWTQNTPDVEYPYIKNIYSLYGAEEKVENLHLPTEAHDFGPSKRKGAYDFFAAHLGLNNLTDESKITVEDVNLLNVYSEEFPRPDYALTTSEEILETLHFTGTYPIDIKKLAVAEKSFKIKLHGLPSKSISVSYTLDAVKNVSIDILDIKGTGKQVIIHPQKEPGVHREFFELNHLKSGIYILRAKFGSDVGRHLFYLP